MAKPLRIWLLEGGFTSSGNLPDPAINEPTLESSSFWLLKDLSSPFTPENLDSLLTQLEAGPVTVINNIFEDEQLTKGEIKVKIVKFMMSLPQPIKEKFVDFLSGVLKKSKLDEARLDEMAERLGFNGLEIYKALKSIYQNDNLTPHQECQEVTTLILQSPPESVIELEKVYGRPVLCKSPVTKNNQPKGNVFNKGLLIPPNSNSVSPGQLDFSQILKLPNGLPSLPNIDILGAYNEFMALVRNLNSLINWLQSFTSMLNAGGAIKIGPNNQGGIPESQNIIPGLSLGNLQALLLPNGIPGMPSFGPLNLNPQPANFPPVLPRPYRYYNPNGTVNRK